jgi:hypothetical protein
VDRHADVSGGAEVAVVATLVDTEGVVTNGGTGAAAGPGGRIAAATTSIATTAPAHVPASSIAFLLRMSVVVRKPRSCSRHGPDVSCVSTGRGSGG